MGFSLYEHFSCAREIFQKADQVLGFSLSEVCFHGPTEKLLDTYYQQLAICVVSIAAYEVFCSQKPEVSFRFTAGLSLGEYTALYASKVLSLDAVLRLVERRASAMQEVSRGQDSGMLAVVGVDQKDIQEQNNKLFYIANLNCPGQVVVSLEKSKIDAAKAFFLSKNAKNIVELKVSGGFHAPFMKGAECLLGSAIGKTEFHDSQIPLVSNVDAKAYVHAEEIKKNLLIQLTHPVLWQMSIEYMVSQGIKSFYEIGPSRVLKGLLRKIDKELVVYNFEAKDDFTKCLSADNS